MRIGTRLILGVALCLTGAANGQPDPAAKLPNWMAGCWVTDVSKSGHRSEECWTLPRGAMMMGSGHTFDAEKSIDFEHMRIVSESGAIAFYAQPRGRPATRFSLEKQVAPGGTAAPEISFVNFKNDYPQRVTYRLVDGNLEAVIARKDGSKPMKWTFKRG